MTEYIDREEAKFHFTNSYPQLGASIEKAVYRALDEVPAADVVPTPKWISVKDAMPPEHDSFFARFYGTTKWDKAMYRKCSEECIVLVLFKDGEKKATTSWTKDGKFKNPNRIMESKITHWMPLPEPPKEKSDADK